MKNDTPPATRKFNTANAIDAELAELRPKDLDDACRAGIIRNADDLRARVQRVPSPQSHTTNGHAPPDMPPAFIEPIPNVVFPIEKMPPVIRGLADECARSMSVPGSLPAVCLIGVVSGALGSRLRVRSIHGKITPGNLMILIGAESGTGKSEVHRVAVAPFHACQEREAKAWDNEVRPAAMAEVRMLQIELKKMAEVLKNEKTVDRASLKRGIAAKEHDLAIYEAQLKPPYYLASDFTTAELINLLSRMDGQLFATSPDAKNFADMVLGRYNEGGTDEEVYLKAFSLEAIDRHRVGDGNRSTPEACIAGLWLTQPDKIERLLGKRELSEGGLLPRLLLANYSCSPLRVNLNEQGIDAELLANWGKLVRGLFDVFRLGKKPLIIEAEEGARVLLADYHNTIADRRESDLRDVTSFAARWGELAWRLALVIHAARLGEDAADEPLTAQDAEAGIALAEWFASQQLHALAHGREQARIKLHDRVMSLFSDDQTEIVARDVYRKGITPRDSTALAEALLKEMERKGLLVSHERETARNGHIQTVWTPRRERRTVDTADTMDTAESRGALSPQSPVAQTGKAFTTAPPVPPHPASAPVSQD